MATNRRYSRTVVAANCALTSSSHCTSNWLSVVDDDEILPAATSVTNDANARCASRLVPRTVRVTCLETLVTGSRGNWTINSQAPGRRSRSEPFMPDTLTKILAESWPQAFRVDGRFTKSAV